MSNLFVDIRRRLCSLSGYIVVWPSAWRETFARRGSELKQDIDTLLYAVSFRECRGLAELCLP